MSSVNKIEIEKFSNMADEWWDPHGKFKPLHKFNPIRIKYIKENIIRQFKIKNKNKPLSGINILDISCGGGLLYGIGDGAKQRTWMIDKLPDGSYRGFAHDVLGEASGESFGNAFHWSYRMEIPVGQRTIEVQFEDWFWALDDSRILTRSYLQKFGFDVAEVTLLMERDEIVTPQ